MTATLAEIREGLAERLRTISGIQVGAYMLPRPEPPSACVLPSRAEFDQTMNSDDTEYYFDLWAYCSALELVKAQQDLDLYMAPSGAKSFRAAVDGDPRLGGVVDYTYVIGWSGYGTLMDVAGIKLLGASLQVRVAA